MNLFKKGFFYFYGDIINLDEILYVVNKCNDEQPHLIIVFKSGQLLKNGVNKNEVDEAFINISRKLLS